MAYAHVWRTACGRLSDTGRPYEVHPADTLTAAIVRGLLVASVDRDHPGTAEDFDHAADRNGCAECASLLSWEAAVREREARA